ncbi:MAG: DegT/DnrJ/EryC1/StrS family aminotransferase [Muribaculaceae bacterium]|nr:DegT/DnrJ/EryC1/StrS family aminotransferase [Muribaculaceae bacterium]
MHEIKYPFLNLACENKPYMDELIEASARVIRSGRYIGGQEVEAFEAMMRDMHSAPYAIGVSNGLDALRLSLRACIATGLLAPGDKVMVPANTYIASVLAITDAGLMPLLVDADEVTMVLTGDVVERNITPDVKALMPVHLYGRVAWDGEMADIAKQRGLIVIEDAAQSIGARAACSGLFGSAHAGALGHAGAFSFYPTKNVGALGDAGAVVTHIPELHKAIRELANYGSDRRYHNIYAGYNCRLDPIQAAMLSVKLRHCNKQNAERFARAVAYNNTIDHPLVTKPRIGPTPTDCVWHQYVIRTPRRDELRGFLSEQGVETDIHYAVPPHMQPCYANLEHMPLPVTERQAAQLISLPISPECTSVKDASDIGRIINKFK